MAVAPVTSAGSYNVLLEEPRIRRRWDGLDEGSFTFWCDSMTYIRPGDSIPGYSGFQARDIDIGIEPDGFQLSCSAIGILGSRGMRKLSSSFSESQDGFDDGSGVWLTTSIGGFNLRSVSSEQGSMYVSSVSFDKLDPEYNLYRANVSYRGLLRGKADKVSISTGAREMGIQAVAVNLPGGWTDPRSGDVLWPRAEVKVSFVSTGVVSMADIPSRSNPPITPAIFSPSLSGDLKYHWPNGWIIVSREVETLVGTSVNFVTETYTYNHVATF